MEAALRSPRGTLKTYGGKRKRQVAYPESSSDDEDDNEETASKKPKSESGSPPKSFTKLKTKMTPASSEKARAPAKVEGFLPGPSPVRSDSETSPSKPKYISAHGHSRSASVKSAGGTSNKPLSMSSRVVKAQTLKRPMTPEAAAGGDDDDTSSIADSLAESKAGGRSGTTIRRSEAERIQYFKDEPECTEIEAFRVFCKRCDSWVALPRRQAYNVKKWQQHRAKCDMQQEVAAGAKNEGSDEEGATPSTSKAPLVKQKSEAERKAIFEADPRVEELRTTEVLCRACHEWILLSDSRRYALTKWVAHSRKCTGTIPSVRVAEAEQKIKLVNDAQAKSFEARSVECRSCDKTVELDGDYDLTTWDAHKLECPLTPELPRSSEVTAPASPVPVPTTLPVRPPPSVGSTDGASTIVVEGGSPRRTQLKRHREETDGGDEEPPSNRVRSDSYIPVATAPPPGPFGWFKVGWQTFVRNFRDGLSATPVQQQHEPESASLAPVTDTTPHES